MSAAEQSQPATLPERITAIVPMRHWSRRVSGKNYRRLGGKSLYIHVVEALLRADSVDRVVLDTDSEPILEEAATLFGDSLVLLRRPEHLRDEFLNANDILQSTISQLEGEVFLQTHSTNPLLRAETIDAAYAAFRQAWPAADSLFAVTPIHRRLWTRDGQAINHNPDELIRTQDLAPIYEENSCMYFFIRDTFFRRRHRLGDRPMTFPMDPDEALDIDTELDWTIVEAVYQATRS
jgi:CMP-N-acetylneuraminic acid synthetase